MHRSPLHLVCAISLALFLALAAPWKLVAQDTSGEEGTGDTTQPIEDFTPTPSDQMQPAEEIQPSDELLEPIAPTEEGTDEQLPLIEQTEPTDTMDGEVSPPQTMEEDTQEETTDTVPPAETVSEDEVVSDLATYDYSAIDLDDYAYGEVPYVRVETSDGWHLALYHYSPPTEFVKLYPVILVHGEGFNRYVWDFDEKHSLARKLAGDLFDTWVIELRGHGLSSIEDAAPSPAADWHFEDYILDVDAAINYVLAQTGAERVQLVGHSTGGTLIYGMMENDQYARKIASAVTLAAPTRFHAPNDTLTQLFVHRDSAYEGDEVDLRYGAYLPAPFAENTQTVYGVLFFNDFFLDPELVEQFTDIGMGKVRTRILKQFADWFAEEKAYSTEEAGYNYDADLNLIRSPVCVFVGWRDNIAQPENVIDAFSTLEPALLDLELFGKMEGHQDYYGHMGLLLNDYAHVDVYPRVSGCLDESVLKMEESIYVGPSFSEEPGPEGETFDTPQPGDEMQGDNSDWFGQPAPESGPSEETPPGEDNQMEEAPGMDMQQQEPDMQEAPPEDTSPQGTGDPSEDFNAPGFEPAQPSDETL